MNQPMYMIANLALGGWGGSLDAGALPAQMKIDYIRAYALADGSSSVALDAAHTGGGSVSTPVSAPAGSSGAAGGSVVGEAMHAAVGGGSLDGGSGDDTLTGDDGGANHLRGGDGADSLVGGSGFNDINGNKGDDHIVGRSSVGDWLLGGQGNDLVEATQSHAHNILNGNLGADTIHGGSGGDSLRGGQGDDLIVGGAGADWLSGDRGADTLTGGQGADTFHVASSGGVATVTDFDLAQGDRVQIDHGATYTAAQSGADVVVTINGGGGEIILQHVQLTSLQGSDWIVAA
jgi:Ca2+-binding RTX toxin-like protein